MLGYRLPGADPLDMYVCINCRVIDYGKSFIENGYRCNTCGGKDTIQLNTEIFCKRYGTFMKDTELLTLLIQKSE